MNEVFSTCHDPLPFFLERIKESKAPNLLSRVYSMKKDEDGPIQRKNESTKAYSAFSSILPYCRGRRVPWSSQRRVSSLSLLYSKGNQSSCPPAFCFETREDFMESLLRIQRMLLLYVMYLWINKLHSSPYELSLARKSYVNSTSFIFWRICPGCAFHLIIERTTS